MAQEHLL